MPDDRIGGLLSRYWCITVKQHNTTSIVAPSQSIWEQSPLLSLALCRVTLFGLVCVDYVLAAMMNITRLTQTHMTDIVP